MLIPAYHVFMSPLYPFKIIVFVWGVWNELIFINMTTVQEISEFAYFFLFFKLIPSGVSHFPFLLWLFAIWVWGIANNLPLPFILTMGLLSLFLPSQKVSILESYNNFLLYFSLSAWDSSLEGRGSIMMIIYNLEDVIILLNLVFIESTCYVRMSYTYTTYLDYVHPHLSSSFPVLPSTNTPFKIHIFL